jgi:hypothetical protein
MAIRIGHMKITFTPRGIVWAVWIKALFHEVCPETVNIRNVKNQPPPLDTSIAVFEVQNRIPVGRAPEGQRQLDAILHVELAVLYFPFRQTTPCSPGQGLNGSEAPQQRSGQRFVADQQRQMLPARQCTGTVPRQFLGHRCF